jgi:phage tail-like protein
LDGPVSLAEALGLDANAVPGHDLAFAGDRLHLVGADGNQVFAFDVGTDNNGRLAVTAVRDGGYFPLRLFAGRALVAAGDAVYYDFGDEWLPVRAQPRPLYVTEGVFESPVFDGRDPGCVWHRLMIDAALPADTGLAVESRAADDPDDLTGQPFDPEPTPYRRATGSELPYLPPPPDCVGTWELLFQRARGRYLQLRLTMRGNGRATPRVRAVRAYYPRFSYLDRYLPAAYRRCPDSAAFLDSFLANVEGTLTAIEDRIAAAQLLFDPRTAPAEALDWLAGWLGKVFDPAWDEGRRRLFLRHAADLFRWRGTVRGLVTALRLALDRCPDDRLFADGPGGWDAAGYRIAEAFRAGPHKAAHRFTVFLPVPVDRSGTDEEMQAARAWAARVVDGEKPAHTVFDVQFYWAAFRVGAAAVGADTRIDRGSRFVPPRPGAVLGQAYLAEGVLAARPPQDATDRTILGRDPVAADPRRGPCR